MPGIAYSDGGGGPIVNYPDSWNYGVNQNVIVVSDGDPKVKVFSAAGINAVSLLPMIADSSGDLFGGMARVYNAESPDAYGSPTFDPPDPTLARHLGGSNILYADGHVKFLQQTKMAQDPNRTGPFPVDCTQYEDCNFFKFLIPVSPLDDRVQ